MGAFRPGGAMSLHVKNSQGAIMSTLLKTSGGIMCTFQKTWAAGIMYMKSCEVLLYIKFRWSLSLPMSFLF